MYEHIDRIRKAVQNDEVTGELGEDLAKLLRDRDRYFDGLNDCIAKADSVAGWEEHPTPDEVKAIADPARRALAKRD